MKSAPRKRRSADRSGRSSRAHSTSTSPMYLASRATPPIASSASPSDGKQVVDSSAGLSCERSAKLAKLAKAAAATDFNPPSSASTTPNMTLDRNHLRDDPDKDEMVTINVGKTIQHQKAFRIVQYEFSILLEHIPRLKNYIDSSTSTIINLHGYCALTFTIIFEWLNTGVLRPLTYGQVSQPLRTGNYDIVDLYTLAYLLGLYDLCDEAMDMMMSAFWVPLPKRMINGVEVEIEVDSGDGIVASLEDISTAYARTGPGNPLRKFMVASLDFILSECVDTISMTHLFPKEKIWETMKSSDDLGMDYVEYVRTKEATERVFHPNPADPRKWSSGCELHLHGVDEMDVCYKRKREQNGKI
ncbi:hypothetical protein ACMFMG_011088 [Clarireedia jacksonii]